MLYPISHHYTFYNLKLTVNLTSTIGGSLICMIHTDFLQTKNIYVDLMHQLVLLKINILLEVTMKQNQEGVSPFLDRPDPTK